MTLSSAEPAQTVNENITRPGRDHLTDGRTLEISRNGAAYAARSVGIWRSPSFGVNTDITRYKIADEQIHATTTPVMCFARCVLVGRKVPIASTASAPRARGTKNSSCVEGSIEEG
jgi:hypothetical protein